MSNSASSSTAPQNDPESTVQRLRSISSQLSSQIRNLASSTSSSPISSQFTDFRRNGSPGIASTRRSNQTVLVFDITLIAKCNVTVVSPKVLAANSKSNLLNNRVSKARLKVGLYETAEHMDAKIREEFNLADSLQYKLFIANERKELVATGTILPLSLKRRFGSNGRIKKLYLRPNHDLPDEESSGSSTAPTSPTPLSTMLTSPTRTSETPTSSTPFSGTPVSPRSPSPTPPSDSDFGEASRPSAPNLVNMSVGESLSFDELESIKACMNGIEEVCLRREFIVNDIFQAYENTTLDQKNIKVKFVGEDGYDAGGLTRDAFSVFYERLCDDSSMFNGMSIVVPEVAPNMRAEAMRKFKMLARILWHSVILTSSFPPLAITAYMKILKPDIEVPDHIVLEDFLNYLSDSERSAVRKALKCANSFEEFDAETLEMLTDIFARYRSTTCPTIRNVYEIIIGIARHVIEESPVFWYNVMSQNIGVPYTQLKSLSADRIFDMMTAGTPTKFQVLKKIETEEPDLTSNQEAALSYLKMFIQDADDIALARFLRYVTGSSSLPKGRIKIKFSTEIGNHFAARTCFNELTIPLNENMRGFQRALKQLLQNEEAMIITAV